MSKVSTPSRMPLPSQSAWAKGPPQSRSSVAPSSRTQYPAASPKPSSHSRRPSAIVQGVSVKDGVSIPRNNVGSASVVFGSIDDAYASAPLSPAAPPAVKAKVVKSFGSVPATFSNHVNGETSASASLKRPSRPSLSSTPSSTIATSMSKPSRADIANLFQNLWSSSPQPSSDTSSPSTRPSSHYQPSSSLP
ncbi:hypothetical protein BDR05DRAFT_1003722 [Suillus weaverae]|nr:hypothetical protein BDR05DRAFT_1003722 [Suillus weaverae]